MSQWSEAGAVVAVAQVRADKGLACRTGQSGGQGESVECGRRGGQRPRGIWCGGGEVFTLGCRRNGGPLRTPQKMEEGSSSFPPFPKVLTSVDTFSHPGPLGGLLFPAPEGRYWLKVVLPC